MVPLLLLCFTAACLLYCYLKSSPQRFPCPPGPPPQPLIGNLRQVPKASPWKTFAEWSRKYNSDVVSFTALGKRVVVLNTARTVADLLEKRGAIYSDRDHNVMLQELIGVEGVTLMPYNDEFRLHRKVMNIALNAKAAREYCTIQEKETYLMLSRILDTPDKWISHLRRAANSAILTTTYGHEVTTEDDYLVLLSERVNKMFRNAIPVTSFLVNLLPKLKYIPDWVPGISFKRYAREGRKLRIELEERPFKEVKDKMVSGDAIPSYVSRLLEAKGSITGDPGVDEKLIRTTAVVMYAGGAESITISVMNVILALLLHSDVQEKAQAEIDAVVGNNRLVTFADQENLPYFNMVLAESLRWNPVSALGVPHVLKEDDIYNDMFIPKGSLVMANQWALLHDETVYPEPHRFWPERFDGRFPNIRPPQNFAFGFNRRRCPGIHLALDWLFIQSANLFAVFSLSKARDDNGNEIEPLVDYSQGLPQPFICTIRPRSDATAELARRAAATTFACK